MAKRRAYLKYSDDTGYIALAEALLKDNEHEYLMKDRRGREALLNISSRSIIRNIVEYTGMDWSEYCDNLIRRGVEYDQRIHAGRAADPSGKADRSRL